jgi:hypothetical protein
MTEIRQERQWPALHVHRYSMTALWLYQRGQRLEGWLNTASYTCVGGGEWLGRCNLFYA